MIVTSSIVLGVNPGFSFGTFTSELTRVCTTRNFTMDITSVGGTGIVGFRGRANKVGAILNLKIKVATAYSVCGNILRVVCASTR